MAGRGVWNGFLFGDARGEIVPCRFCGGAEGDGHLFCRSGSGRFDRRWGHLDLLPADSGLSVERSVLFESVPGPLQSVQRAEFQGVILALQSSSAVHLGVDNLNVVRHVSGILAGSSGRRLCELCVDVDLLTRIEVRSC